MSNKITLSAKVEQPLADRVEEYAEEHGLKRSPAIRDLLTAGLDAEDRPEGFYVTRPALISMFGWPFIAAAFADADPILGYLGLALVAGAILDTALTRLSNS
jgi:hypothetical protein